jgi:hypothetical protein
MDDLAKWVVEQRLVSEEDLSRARELQRQTGVPLAMALCELQLLEEKAIVELVASKHGLPVAPRQLHKLTVPPKALSLVPQDYCWQYNAFPFGLDASTRKLMIAIVDPADAEAVDALRKIARLEVSLHVAGPRQIEKAIRRHYLDSWVEETNAPAKRLRYFGYDNITNPGVEAKRPTVAAPTQPDEDLGASLGPLEPVSTPEPSALPPVPPPAVAAELEWESAPPAAPSQDDLPVLKSAPQLPVRQLGRIQPADALGDALQRLERIERAFDALLDLLGRERHAESLALANLRESLKAASKR